MSVEPGEMASELWTRWQGTLINGAFPLGRFVGCSDHSGVFVTTSAAFGPSDLAIKLVATDRALAEVQLPRWKRAGGITHSHLLRLLQWGGCQLDGLPYLYLVMEYAEQTLAQVLQRRALAEDEAHKMLRPTLDALAYLHGQNLVLGQLQPANILVVGDELKLASDTIRRATEGPVNPKAPAAYDPPEARLGNSSAASDIWALGSCLFEALTRRPPTAAGETGEGVALPGEIPPAFRDIVSRCLSPNPQNRPTAAELAAGARGDAVKAAPDAGVQREATASREPTALVPSRDRPEPTREASSSAPPTAWHWSPRVTRIAACAAVVVLALGWAAVRMVPSHRGVALPPVSESPSTQISGAAPLTTGESRSPAATPSTPRATRSETPASAAAQHEVLPEVSDSARRTIRGHIKVWVRVIVDRDGSVFAATADRAGPSRYFERLAIEAAKQWEFTPLDTQSRRLVQIRFDFSRDGTTARSVLLN